MALLSSQDDESRRYRLFDRISGGSDPAPCSGTTTRPTISTTAAALTATLGLAAACWVFAVREMNGMDMGVATQLGSFVFFVAVWISMMAAMMLPGAAPAVLRFAHANGGIRGVPLFVGSYLVVWGLVGVAVYAVDRPHGTIAAGAVAIAAGVYEFTPFKQHFRRCCRERVHSGFEFGLYCVGSSMGLMLMLVALGVMSVTWMSVIAVLVLAQKLLPAKAAIDVPLALAIVGLGILISLKWWVVSAQRMRMCDRCVAEQPYGRIHWRLPVITECLKHRSAESDSRSVDVRVQQAIQSALGPGPGQSTELKPTHSR